MHKKQALLGAHMSISGGLENAITSGESINCTCIQIFTHSNRQWQMRPIKKEESQKFKDAQQKSNIKTVAVHASYLINIGSINPETRKKSIDTLLGELEHCKELDIPYLIMHPGSATGSTQEDCLQVIANSLNEILSKTENSDTTILIENMAGQGSSVGYKFEHLAFIREKVKHNSRIGICFDTCHAFTAGYDFSTSEKYESMWKEFDKVIGLKHLKAMHINDSKNILASNVDRHEDIGKGKIGLEAFKLIMNDPKLQDIPKILETPKDDKNWKEDDLKNLETLRNLLK